ncbi:hypothetical protein [Sphingosinicella terrae]|uniref:hypothetical protein n=1 Tax=Sphingosinicella terrae TaxID=2172047 RepID=UPI000E0CC55D|nr:hypothetical protein [Sphingosinicella terrae]
MAPAPYWLLPLALAGWIAGQGAFPMDSGGWPGAAQLPAQAGARAATTASDESVPRTHGSADCPLAVDFLSESSGIDGQALQDVEAFLADRIEVTAMARRHWGWEGETTLCVQVGSEAQARSLFRRIRRALPERPQAPITVRTASGRHFSLRPAR